MGRCPTTGWLAVALVLGSLASGCASMEWRTREVPQGIRSDPQPPTVSGDVEILVDREDELVLGVSLTRHQETRHFEAIEVIHEEKLRNGPLASLPWLGLGGGSIATGIALHPMEQPTVVEVASETLTSSGPVIEGVTYVDSTEIVDRDKQVVAWISMGAVLATVGVVQLVSPTFPPNDRRVEQRILDLPSTTESGELARAHVTVRLEGEGEVGAGTTDAEGRARVSVVLPDTGEPADKLVCHAEELGRVEDTILDIKQTRAYAGWISRRAERSLSATPPDIEGARGFALSAPEGSKAAASVRPIWCGGIAAPFAAAVEGGESHSALSLLDDTGHWPECRDLWDGARRRAAQLADRAIQRREVDEANDWYAYMNRDPGVTDEELDRFNDRIEVLERRLESEAEAAAERTLKDQRASWKGRTRKALGRCDDFVSEVWRRRAEMERLARNFDDRLYEVQEQTDAWLTEQQDGAFGDALEDLNTIMMEMEDQESEGFDTRQMRYELARQTESRCQP